MTAEKEITDFMSKQACKLPRWNELPEIGLYMDQVISLMGKYTKMFSRSGETALTPSMINNYVKLEILPPPVKKKYSRVHISHLLIICAMKSILPIRVIAAIIEHLLKTRTEEELFNFFCDQYEQTLCELCDMLNSSEDNAENNLGTALTMTAIKAAAVSSGSKLISENALAEMQRLNILKLRRND